ncbi:hypothetical protein SE17_02100, partial [Kouleothrix aurantiaca]
MTVASLSRLRRDLTRQNQAALKACLLLFLLALFLLGSRLPAEYAKVAAVQSSWRPEGAVPISFSDRWEVAPDAPAGLAIALTALNFWRANLLGMTFGLAIGGAALSLLLTAPAVERALGRRGFGGVLLGAVLGAPLNLCANCAAVTSEGACSRTRAPEAAYGIVLGSALWNIVGLTTIATLFPRPVVIARIVFSAALTFVALPLLSRALAHTQTLDPAGVNLAVPVVSWRDAGVNALYDWWRSCVTLAGRLLPLMIVATLLAAERGFFIGWQPESEYFGLIICALTLGFVVLGQGLRRVAARYAPPYEIVGYALLTFAFLPTFRDARAATLTWAAMLALYTLARWLYRRRWATLPALLALDMALLSGAGWLLPDGRPAGSALILLGAAWFQGLLALWAARGTPFRAAPDIKSIQPAGVVAFISGTAALMIASRADDVLAIAGFGLAALLALWATLRRNDIAAWSALVFVGIALAAAHRFFGLDPRWSMAWGVAEALALCLLGWGLDFVRSRQAGDSPLAVWGAPLSYGPLAAGVLLTAALASSQFERSSLPPLTFALATLALVFATTAAQQRRSEYAYAAAGALVLAGLCQIYDWGFREPQWFVLPGGLYMLALAVCIRRFQHNRQAAQMLESGALVLMLG